jgi:hypothetical protein
MTQEANKPGTPLPWRYEPSMAAIVGADGSAVSLRDAVTLANAYPAMQATIDELVAGLRNLLDAMGVLTNPSALVDWLPEHEAEALLAILAKHKTPAQ